MLHRGRNCHGSGRSGSRQWSKDSRFHDLIGAIGIGILLVGIKILESKFLRLRKKRESKAVSIEAIHELPGIDNLRLRFGFREGSRKNRAKGEPGRRSWGGSGRWVEVKKAISGGSKGDDVVGESGGTQLGKLVVVVQKMGRSTAHD